MSIQYTILSSCQHLFSFFLKKVLTKRNLRVIVFSKEVSPVVSYKPLWHTLIDRDMKKMELVEKVGMSRATLSKLNNDQYVSLEVLDRICEVLECPIQDVVKIENGE